MLNINTVIIARIIVVLDERATYFNLNKIAEYRISEDI